MTTRLDHVSFAVHDAHRWASRLRRVLGATPIAGEVLPEFRWVMFHVGNVATGGRLEIMEPTGEGFLRRFLDHHGEGAHHITFMVDDLRSVVEQVRELGAQVVGEVHGHAAWEEAFVFPDPRVGVVIQLAKSDREYPGAEELLASTVRHPERYPASRGASEVTWWHPVWQTPAGPRATVVKTDLASADLGYTRALLEGVLGGQRSVAGDVETYSWSGGILGVTRAADPGVKAVELHRGDPVLRIGEVRVGPPSGSERELV